MFTLRAHVRQKTGEFIIYAFLLFKQPYVPRYIKRVIDKGTRTISSIFAKLLVSYPKTMYQVISIRSTTTPCTHPFPSSVVIFQHPPVLMQSAPRHSLLVTSTRGWQHGRRVNVPRCVARGMESLIDPLLREYFFFFLFFPFFLYFPFLFFFFLPYARRYFIRAYLLSFVSSLWSLRFNFFFSFSFSLRTVSRIFRIFEAERKRGMKNNDLKCLTR